MSFSFMGRLFSIRHVARFFFSPRLHSSLHCAVAGRQWIDRLDRTLSHLSDARVEDVPAGW